MSSVVTILDRIPLKDDLVRYILTRFRANKACDEELFFSALRKMNPIVTDRDSLFSVLRQACLGLETNIELDSFAGELELLLTSSDEQAKDCTSIEMEVENPVTKKRKSSKSPSSSIRPKRNWADQTESPDDSGSDVEVVKDGLTEKEKARRLVYGLSIMSVGSASFPRGFDAVFPWIHNSLAVVLNSYNIPIVYDASIQLNIAGCDTHQVWSARTPESMARIQNDPSLLEAVRTASDLISELLSFGTEIRGVSLGTTYIRELFVREYFKHAEIKHAETVLISNVKEEKLMAILQKLYPSNSGALSFLPGLLKVIMQKIVAQDDLRESIAANLRFYTKPLNKVVEALYPRKLTEVFSKEFKAKLKRNARAKPKMNDSRSVVSIDRPHVNCKGLPLTAGEKRLVGTFNDRLTKIAGDLPIAEVEPMDAMSVGHSFIRSLKERTRSVRDFLEKRKQRIYDRILSSRENRIAELAEAHRDEATAKSKDTRLTPAEWESATLEVAESRPLDAELRRVFGSSIATEVDWKSLSRILAGLTR